MSPPLPGQSPVSQLPVISEEASITGAPPPPPPPPAPGPPPPPPPPAAHPKLKATQSAPANVQNETSSNPQVIFIFKIDFLSHPFIIPGKSANQCLTRTTM